MGKMTAEQKEKLAAARKAAKEKKDAESGAGVPPTTKAEPMDAAQFQQSMLQIAQNMQSSIEGVKAATKDLTVRMTRLEGKPITAPMDFQPQIDENVPAAASQAVRAVLGNKVLLRAREAENMPGFFLDVIVPDALHTQYQIDKFKQQREVVTKDPATGKVIEKRMEDWVQEDVRSRYIPQFGMVEAARKWAMAVADNINREYAKARLPQVNFFE